MRKHFLLLVGGIILLNLYFLLLRLHIYIFPQADDLCRNLSTDSLSSIIQASVGEYFTWTGRFTVTMIEYFFNSRNVWIWKLVNPLIIIAMICLINVISSKIKFFSAQNIPSLLLLTILFFSLDLNISTETLYWMSGSINYLWTSVTMLVFIFVWMRLIMNNTKINKIYYFILPLLGIVAGGIHEQVGLIIIWFIVAMLAWKFFIAKTGISRFYIVLLCLVVLSYLVLIFAPGNVHRAIMNERSLLLLNIGFYERIVFRVHEILLLSHSLESIVFVELLLFVAVVIDILGKGNKFAKKSISFILSLMMFPYSYLLLLQFGNIEGFWRVSTVLFPFPQLTGSIATIGIFYILWFLNFIALLIYCSIILIKNKDPRLLIFFVSAFLSQCVMVFAPFSSFRTFLITIIFYWCSLIYVISRFDNKVIKLTIGFIICFSVVGIFHKYYMLMISFKENYAINHKNEELIQKNLHNYSHNHPATNIVLFKMPHVNYVSFMPYEDETSSGNSLRKCYKSYYGLNNIPTTIVWK